MTRQRFTENKELVRKKIKLNGLQNKRKRNRILLSFLEILRMRDRYRYNEKMKEVVTKRERKRYRER